MLIICYKCSTFAAEIITQFTIMTKKKKEDQEQEKEHKKSWQETTASEQDILDFLNSNVVLRRNEITGETEFRVPSISSFTAAKNMYPTGKTALDEWRTDQWYEVDDRFVNSLANILSVEKTVNTKKIWQVLHSDFVPNYNPFRNYLNHLPPWDEKGDPIMSLSFDIKVKGGVDEQLFFYVCLRKWFVAMVAGWLEEDVVNQEILVFIGRQGIYKTTWFANLLPPELKQYFHSNTSFGNMTKDEVLKLSKYGLICCEELDTMKPAEMNRLKWAVTTVITDERKPYAHTSERRKHIASYCGTGNNLQFIDDDTGTRRWLPFEVMSIRSPHEYRIHHEEIFAQAYKLYLSGFQYWFNDEEMKLVARHNERFEVCKPERELISRFYRVPNDGEPGVFVSATEIMQNVGGLLTSQLTKNKLGRAMTALGFESVRSHGQRGYIVVEFSGEQIKHNKSILAYDAKPEEEATAVSGKEILDTNDTIF